MSKRHLYTKGNHTPLREAWKRKFFSCGQISDQTGFWLSWGRLNVPKECRKYRAYVVLSPRRIEFRLFDHVYFVSGQLRRDPHHEIVEPCDHTEPRVLPFSKSQEPAVVSCPGGVHEGTVFDYPKSELVLGLRLNKTLSGVEEG